MAAGTNQGPFLKRVARKWDRFWTDRKLARRKAVYRRKAGPPVTKTPVFIVGCQRSGTDMAIKTLDHALVVDRFDEYDDRAFDDCRIRDLATRQRLIADSTATFAIFKPVCDTHRVTELLAEHPEGKVIWMYRRYQDVANSSVERWGDRTKEWLVDLLNGGGDWGTRQWNREKITDECLAEVRQACPDNPSPHEAATLFWYMRNRTFFEQQLENNPAVLLACYEETVTRPQEEFTRICRFLDIDFSADLTEKIFASSVRKREFPQISARVEELCNTMQARLDRVRAAGG
jgi:hypothetical protein